MFGSNFSLGLDLSDVVGQITALLGNPLVIGLVAATLGLLMTGRLLVWLRRVGYPVAQSEQPGYVANRRPSLTMLDMDAMRDFDPAVKAMRRKDRRGYTQAFGRGKKWRNRNSHP